MVLRLPLLLLTMYYMQDHMTFVIFIDLTNHVNIMLLLIMLMILYEKCVFRNYIVNIQIPYLNRILL